MKKLKINFKKNLFWIFLFTLTASASLLKAQNSPMDKIFEKYNGEKGFTTVNISKEMFQLFSNINAGSTKDSEEFSNVVNKLNGLRILSYSDDSDFAFYNDIMQNISKSEYKEIMTVKDESSDVKFLAKKKGNNFCELIMIAKDSSETTLLYFTGNIDLKSISNLSKGMNFKGMDKLNDLEKEKNKKPH